MVRLSVRLLGGFQVELDGHPLTGFRSDRVRALLAFLAAEAGQAHSRDLLAWMLYPDMPDKAAHTNLRSVIANLRRVIGEPLSSAPHLIVDRRALQFNLSSEQWLDAAALASLVEVSRAEPGPLTLLQEAIELYRGPFLHGFSLRDSAPFEEWLQLRREQIGRQVMAGLSRLAAYYEGHAAYERATECAWKMIEVEPASEQARRQLIRLLALGGHRCAAIRQYAACRRVLAGELGVEPSHETTLLYEAIRDERLDVYLAGGAGPCFGPPIPRLD
jgi:DNA-binding SARP family transcriptional activator